MIKRGEHGSGWVGSVSVGLPKRHPKPNRTTLETDRIRYVELRFGLVGLYSEINKPTNQKGIIKSSEPRNYRTRNHQTSNPEIVRTRKHQTSNPEIVGTNLRVFFNIRFRSKVWI